MISKWEDTLKNDNVDDQVVFQSRKKQNDERSRVEPGPALVGLKSLLSTAPLGFVHGGWKRS